MWSLRRYKECREFINECIRLEKVLFMDIESDREYKLIEIISELLLKDEIMICYKKNKIEDSGELEMIKKMGEITKNIFNNLDEYTYRIVRVTSEKIFERCKKMIYKYRGFE